VEVVNPLPSGVNVVQIGLSGSAYFVLGTNGKIYSLGENATGVLGIGSTTDQTSWQTVKNIDGTGDLENVKFISGSDNGGKFQAMSVILNNGQVLSWGSNSYTMLGASGNPVKLPQIPAGSVGLVANYVENGGHITPFTTNGLYCNVGHNLNGGFGDGTTTSRSSYSCSEMSVKFLALTELPSCDDDNDGIKNYYDLDSDNDGIPDNVEAQTTAGYIAPTGSVDANGTWSAVYGVNGLIPIDTDRDKVTDYLDTDSDNDGIADKDESGLIPTGADATYKDVNGDVNAPATDLKESDNNSTDVDYRSLTINIPPIAVDSNHSISIGTSINLALLTGASDGNNDTLNITSVNGVAIVARTEQNITVSNGVVNIATDGSMIFVPDTNYAGRVTFPYELSDGTDTVSANVNIIINGDTDGDGITDDVDLDDDNDGILDTVEEHGTANLDTDGDGIPDRLDLDSDNDGILDILESGQEVATVDTNNDGRLDSTTDADKDGVMDTADANDGDAKSAGKVTPIDSDGDTKPDFQDVDSDNDSITDAIEAGVPTDKVDARTGMIANPTVDANGISTVTPTVTTPINSDGDSVPNYRDLDSDNDGLNDITEAGGVDANSDGQDDTPNTSFVDVTTIPDEDGDGLSDQLEPNNPNLPTILDANGDGVIDDTKDTDGDGIPDIIDKTPDAFATQPSKDSDGDGIVDAFDLDNDNDGIPDVIELDGDPTRDTDEDGIIDSLDLDSDNDGILDILESGQEVAKVDTNNDGRLDSTTDADKDGLMDTADADDGDASSAGKVTPIDTDGDTKPDFQDVDSDSDSIADAIEAGVPADKIDVSTGMIANPKVDANGIPTVTPSVTTPINTDGDSVPNYRDLDSDNDGLTDVEEVEELDENKDGMVDVEETLVDASSLPDEDGDSIPDVLEVDNPNLLALVDANGDGIIDDVTDSDGDGIPDITDVKVNIFGSGIAVDSDGDGSVDMYDIDDDNDGIPDVVENRGDPKRDTDGDGVIDSLDLDADNDGILDIVEAGGVDANNDGRVDDVTDTDKDGLADVVDASKDTADNPVDESAGKSVTLLSISDTDGDTKPDFQDIDSDNDGLSDLIEAGIDESNDDDNNGMIDGGVDANGISTVTTPIEYPLDSDSDGNPDYKELDSDNDGKNDIIEAGAEDIDNNGLVDTTDGLIAISDLLDTNSNGVFDYREIPVVIQTSRPVRTTSNQGDHQQ